MSQFVYEPTFQYGADDTSYRLIGREGISTIPLNGRALLKVEPEALKRLAKQAFVDISFYLRTSHLAKLAEELKDPEASDNDRFVIYTHLQNAVTAAAGELPSRLAWTASSRLRLASVVRLAQ